MKIYVASSWRCPYYPEVVVALRSLGHDVYDFRNPAPGQHGFAWSEIDLDWTRWDPHTFRTALGVGVACRGFGLDMAALALCDACVAVLPCGRSAHLELGYAIGAGKRTAVYVPEGVNFEPELMYKMLDAILITPEELRAWAQQ